MLDTTIRPEEAFLYVEAVAPRQCPYINLHELEEALELYFEGRLNFVDDKYLVNLYKEANQLISGKPLLSVLDDETMTDSIKQLPLEHRAVLLSYYCDSSKANNLLSKWLPRGMRLDDYQSYLIVDAINALAEVVHKLL
ncbi:hypothetical protein [Pseudanabaena sp. FACHB-2040]|uniref:hypothetical protein n=1 Tax=Pseudanabaena sp. FACHB-2040 TaxID=2692859 RepID=UPI001685B1D3|nr:hypothetical protein [Pseudanabaena sp. FACHB-2040]MBD2256669.1 hypothetical protein [Pseudanabaena sp. FACHB-2040]